MRPGHGGELKTPHNEATVDCLDFSVNLNPFVLKPTDSEWLSWKNSIHHYPAPTPEKVNQLISQYLGIKGDCLLSTNGGMEAIRMALSLNLDQKIIIPIPCFSEYPHLCSQLGITYHLQQIPPALWSDGASWLDIPIEPNTTILLANPNNPTGASFSLKKCCTLLETTQELGINWIVDEAFIEFTKNSLKGSLLQVMEKYPNLLIAGSLTKTWAIPGLRIGYLATANPEWFSILRNRQSTWPLNSLIQSWAETFLVPDRIQNHRNLLKKNQETREAFIQALQKLEKIKPLTSDASYILCQTNPAHKLYEFLASQSIYVRQCDNIPGMKADRYLRIAVRNPCDNQRLIQAIQAFEKRPI